MRDAQFKFYFDRERAVSEIARLVRDARLESGVDQRTPSLDLLERIASALKAKLLVSFEYQKAA